MRMKMLINCIILVAAKAALAGARGATTDHRVDMHAAAAPAAPADAEWAAFLARYDKADEMRTETADGVARPGPERGRLCWLTTPACCAVRPGSPARSTASATSTRRQGSLSTACGLGNGGAGPPGSTGPPWMG